MNGPSVGFSKGHATRWRLVRSTYSRSWGCQSGGSIMQESTQVRVSFQVNVTLKGMSWISPKFQVGFQVGKTNFKIAITMQLLRIMAGFSSTTPQVHTFNWSQGWGDIDENTDDQYRWNETLHPFFSVHRMISYFDPFRRQICGKTLNFGGTPVLFHSIFSTHLQWSRSLPPWIDLGFSNTTVVAAHWDWGQVYPCPWISISFPRTHWQDSRDDAVTKAEIQPDGDFFSRMR